MDQRILFICKSRNVGYHYNIPYGLRNSARFVSEALIKYDIDSKVVDVIDGNSIDHEVFNYKPTHVMIEALWVTPTKIEELLRRYPKINWTVRIHSKVPFIAMEGIAIEWLLQYRNIAAKYNNFNTSANSPEFNKELSSVLRIDAKYLPNVYLVKKTKTPKKPKNKELHIGCFGAIRPLKNHLKQAFAAITFANKIKRKLFFHVNYDRIEQRGEPILKNLRALFADNDHMLVEHAWMKHDDFIKLVRQMDLGMQISFTESFNIVAADFVSQNIPIVVSPDVTWMSCLYKADPNNMSDIICGLKLAWYGRKIYLQTINKLILKLYTCNAIRLWLRYLSN